MTEISNSSHFDWTNPDDVCIPAVAAVAVYANVNGDVVIRQTEYPWQDEDQLVIIPAIHIPRLINKLREVHSKLLLAPTGDESNGDSAAAPANS